jgi:U3 small nucleolar RNA-associated protein 11
MQRLLVGKGGRKKVQGPKEVHAEGGDSDEGEDKRTSNQMTYKPRVYKWRIERKR